MVELKFIFSTGEELIKVPTSWDDVSFEAYAQLVNLKSEDWMEKAAILTGQPANILRQCNEATITSMVNCIMFLSDHDRIVQAGKNTPDEFKDWDIRDTEYGQIEEVDQILGASYDKLKADLGRDPEASEVYLNRLLIGHKIVEVYTRKRISKEKVLPGMDVKGEPVTKVLGLVNFFLSKYQV